MASYLFQFLNGTTERVGADRVDYDEVERMFRAVCDAEGVVYIAPSSNVLGIRKNPPLTGDTAMDLYVDEKKVQSIVQRALQDHDLGLTGVLRTSTRL